MFIGKIVGSNSHLDYVARVADALDVAEPPGAETFGFGRFVAMKAGGSGDLVGVVYDTKVIDPDYSNFGPRLSPKPELAHFSPDYLSEQGILIGILALGTLGAVAEQRVPRRAVPAGQEVAALAAADILRFHRSPDGRLRMRYFPEIVAHARSFALPVIDAIIEQLVELTPGEDNRRLEVLKDSLRWQRTVGGTRL